jgi:cytochrome b561
MNGSHYTPTAKLLHWLVAGMIVVQFVLAQLADNAPSDLRELALLANHKSVGITILVVAMVRVAWRLLHTPPALPATMPRWQVTASAISHWSLYALLFAVPVTGWLMSSASAYSVSWFNLFQLPDFVSPNPDLKDVFEEIHEIVAGQPRGVRPDRRFWHSMARFARGFAPFRGRRDAGDATWLWARGRGHGILGAAHLAYRLFAEFHPLYGRPGRRHF